MDTFLRLFSIIFFLYLRRLHQLIFIRRLMAAIFLILLAGMEWRSIRRYANQIRQRDPPLLLLGRRKQRRNGWHRNRPTMAKFSGQIEEMTGISSVFFFNIHDHLVAKGRLTSKPALTTELQLLLVLNWLREMPKLLSLAIKFEIAKSLASVTINTLIYDLREVLAELAPIKLPAEWSQHPFEGVVGAVDCTSHYRCRVHPGQALYYRGDKHAHFLTAQVLCSMDGTEIYDVTLGLGHNNDSGMAIITGLKEGLLEANVKVIADGGYGTLYAVRPTDHSSKQWCAEHAARRSVIERVNARTATFAASCINTGKFRGPPELQVVALMCIYHLVQHGLETAPLYANRSGPARWRWSYDDPADGESASESENETSGGESEMSESEMIEEEGSVMEMDDSEEMLVLLSPGF